MRCYNCGGFLYEGDTCNVCGADVSVYKSIIEKSNALYNEALEYSKNRNLSRAAQCLEVALKLNKRNVNARNLLGLIYYEVGSYTEALAQWVISKNIQPENNLANDFIDSLQENRADLDKINSSIKKYNKAVERAKQGSYDLAEIQLKKLLNDNPKMVRGHQLLALLLIKKNKLEDAKVALKKAERIDGGDAITIAYQNHVNQEIKEEEKGLSPLELKAKREATAPEEEHTPLSGDDVIIPKSEYKEHNPVVMTIIQLIIGIVIGAAIIFFIVTPAKVQSTNAELANVKTEYENQIASLNSRITELEGGSSSSETTGNASDNYSKLIEALSDIMSGEVEAGTTILTELDPENITNSSFKKVYETYVDPKLQSAAANYAASGAASLEAGDFATAATNYANSYLLYKKNNEDACFLAATSYQNAGDNANAKKYYELYVSDNPKGQRVEECNTALSTLGDVTTDDTADVADDTDYVEEETYVEEAPVEEYYEEETYAEETQAEEVIEQEPVGYDEEGNPIY